MFLLQTTRKFLSGAIAAGILILSGCAAFDDEPELGDSFGYPSQLNESISLNPVSSQFGDGGELSDRHIEELLPDSYPLIESLSFGTISDEGEISGSSFELPRILSEIVTSEVTGRAKVHLHLNEIQQLALKNSLTAQISQLNTLEARQVVGEELGAFDLTGFGRVAFSDETQAENRSQGTDEFEAGIEKQFKSGGNLTLSTATPLANSGNNTLTLNVSKQLLRDGGKIAVMNEVLVAQFEAERVSGETVEELAQLVVDVTTAYWNLFKARAEYIIRRQQVRFAEELVDILDSRKNLDAEQNSIALARATIEERRIQLEQAKNNLLTEQNQLLGLLNLEHQQSQIELIPTDIPNIESLIVDREQIIEVATSNRPEVFQAWSEIQQSELELALARNQSLPEVEIFVESTLQGREGDSAEDNYLTGINFNQSLFNRTARFQRRRRELELARTRNELANTVSQVVTEVNDAVNQLELLDSQNSLERMRLEHASAEVSYLKNRVDRIPRKDSNLSFQINQIFDAQDRQGDSLFNISQLLGDFQIALVALEQAKGNLVARNALHGDSIIARENFEETLRQIKSANRQFEAKRISTVKEVNSKLKSH